MTKEDYYVIFKMVIFIKSLVDLEFASKRQLELYTGSVTPLPGVDVVDEIAKGIKFPQTTVGTGNFCLTFFLFWRNSCWDFNSSSVAILSGLEKTKR